jgi:hypothetical protein
MSSTGVHGTRRRFERKFSNGSRYPSGCYVVAWSLRGTRQGSPFSKFARESPHRHRSWAHRGLWWPGISRLSSNVRGDVIQLGRLRERATSGCLSYIRQHYLTVLGLHWTAGRGLRGKLPREEPCLVLCRFVTYVGYRVKSAVVYHEPDDKRYMLRVC